MDADGSVRAPIVLCLLLLALLFGLTLLWLELRHRLRPASPLRLRPGPRIHPPDR
jgi:hypothetical protein